MSFQTSPQQWTGNKSRLVIEKLKGAYNAQINEQSRVKVVDHAVNDEREPEDGIMTGFGVIENKKLKKRDQTVQPNR